jgi:hypothetical protein
MPPNWYQDSQDPYEGYGIEEIEDPYLNYGSTDKINLVKAIVSLLQ